METPGGLFPSTNKRSEEEGDSKTVITRNKKKFVASFGSTSTRFREQTYGGQTLPDGPGPDTYAGIQKVSLKGYAPESYSNIRPKGFMFFFFFNLSFFQQAVHYQPGTRVAPGVGFTVAQRRPKSSNNGPGPTRYNISGTLLRPSFNVLFHTKQKKHGLRRRRIMQIS